MIRVQQTSVFAEWLADLDDDKARAVIIARIRRITLGNWGDFKAIEAGLYEIRIFYGPGYRLYFMKKGVTWILLLCGGNKSTQAKDIKRARKMKEEV